jgi:hypothetical protein
VTTQTDDGLPAAELQKRRADIDAQIAHIKEGHLTVMEPTQVRERFLQMTTTACELLSDFRALDQNFRTLDRSVREQIATYLLISPARQDELSKLLEQVMALAPIRELEPDTRLFRIHSDWHSSRRNGSTISRSAWTAMRHTPQRSIRGRTNERAA